MRHVYTAYLSNGYSSGSVTKIYACERCSSLTANPDPDAHVCRASYKPSVMVPALTVKEPGSPHHVIQPTRPRPERQVYDLIDAFAGYYVWQCRSCDTKVSGDNLNNVQEHDCKPHWTTPPYQMPHEDSPELEKLKEAAMELYKSPYTDREARHRVIDAALDYAETQAPKDGGKVR